MALLRLVLLSLLVTIFIPQAGWTQTDSPTHETSDYPDDGADNEAHDDEKPGLSDASQLVTQLADISALCKGAGVYAIDCLAERLETLEKEMHSLVGYGDARRILRDTAAQLEQIAQNNLDQNQSRARMQTADGNQRSTRPLAAVSPARRRQALSQAVAVLAEAETQLLRSAETSARRSVQYQQIAAALGSNKVLLRSS
ncbi:hypothetical protein [Parasedimentitalea huanghaiensis]|uniref:Uncharacterized protein n=1 Tax=Parasedimentitalea huanghaiensis TaxID=2682100 RepID=A0A6L6WPQ1_9RHOB|nr:hypothetical protein [Zongyanglinia huanghaiensis]MVO18675.1 hypothetical protein [Zongyanglinia huanghaiensis]